MAKVVAIISASSGMGAATAGFLAGRGDKVVLGARGADRLAEVTNRIIAAGGQAAQAEVDVTKRADLEKLVTLARERFRRLDVLISNAGAMPIGPMDDLAVEDWEQMVDVNIKGVLYGIAAALPIFRKQEAGHFINIASTSARKTVPGQSVYSCTKAAVVALSDGLRQELAGKLRFASRSSRLASLTPTSSTTLRTTRFDSSLNRRARSSRYHRKLPRKRSLTRSTSPTA